MAFDNSFLAVTAATYTAAQYNTYTRGNLNEIWKYTTAGDIVYATSATALSRLAIGAANSVLTSSGTAPQWTAGGGLKGQINALGWDNQTAGHTTTSTTGSDIPGLTFDLSTTKTCTIMMWIWGSIALTGGSAIWNVGVRGHIGGTGQTIDVSIPRGYYPQYEPYSNFYQRTGIAAGVITCKAQLFVEDASRTANFLGGSIFAMAVVE